MINDLGAYLRFYARSATTRVIEFIQWAKVRHVTTVPHFLVVVAGFERFFLPNPGFPTTVWRTGSPSNKNYSTAWLPEVSTPCAKLFRCL